MAEGTFQENDGVSSIAENSLIYAPVDLICGLRAMLNRVFFGKKFMNANRNGRVLPIHQLGLKLDIQRDVQIAPENTWSVDREIWDILCASSKEPLELDHGVRLSAFNVTIDIERELAQGMRAECSVILDYPVVASGAHLYDGHASVTFSCARGVEGWNVNLVIQAIQFLRDCLQEVLNPTVS